MTRIATSDVKSRVRLAATLRAEAQSSIEEVLRSVEANNKELQATRQQVEAQTLEAKLDNNLPDPTVTYSHLYGNQEGMGFTGEFIASQSFDFPSLYAQRRKWSKLQGENFNKQGEEVRQQILLQAKEVCLDLILLNQQQRLLDLRRENAEQLSKLYAERLENGDANILETNKINLELLNVRNEARMNEAARTAKLQELAALNGGIAISFTDTAYVPVDQPASLADLQQEVLTADRRLQSLRSAQQAALRQISVSKAKGLPSFELGYRMNPSSGGNLIGFGGDPKKFYNNTFRNCISMYRLNPNGGLNIGTRFYSNFENCNIINCISIGEYGFNLKGSVLHSAIKNCYSEYAIASHEAENNIFGSTGSTVNGYNPKDISPLRDIKKADRAKYFADPDNHDYRPIADVRIGLPEHIEKGDTILLPPGKYPELKISQDNVCIKLRGSVFGAEANGAEITGNNVRLEGITFTAPVHISGDNAAIRSCEFRKAFTATGTRSLRLTRPSSQATADSIPAAMISVRRSQLTMAMHMYLTTSNTIRVMTAETAR